ncbi:CDP-glycerol glycerophosphotransferase family protein [Salinicola halimionae]|uniref:CDP-glycerol glycerophosphotransferase family protein n=1 Tax=Salinicola halimionae TaxID=1949081 RepID=UPI0013001704|nr:CDP-glycerol glycerophosphotransferase family protein [Salinicola halimionae]
MIGLVKAVFNSTPKSYQAGLKPYREKRWESAVSYFEKAVNEKPDHAPSHFKLGMSWFRRKEYEKAERHIAQAMKLDPSRAEWNEQYEQVLRHLKKIEDKEPLDNERDVYLAALQLAAIKADYEEVFRLVELAEEAVNRLKSYNKDLSKIRRFSCEAALMNGEAARLEISLGQLDTKDSLYHVYLAILKYYQGNSADALAELQMTPNATSKPDIAYVISKILKDVGQKNAAWGILENVLSYSRRTATWLHLANLVDNVSDLASYITLLDRWCKKAPAVRYHRDISRATAKAASSAGNYKLAHKTLHDSIYRHASDVRGGVPGLPVQVQYLQEKGLPQWVMPYALLSPASLLDNRDGRFRQALKALMELANFRDANVIALQETLQWLLREYDNRPPPEMKFCVSKNSKTDIFLKDLKYRSFFSIQHECEESVELKHSNGIEVVLCFLNKASDWVEYSYKGVVYRHTNFDVRRLPREAYDCWVPADLNSYFKESGVSRSLWVEDWVLESTKKTYQNENELISYAYECLLNSIIRENNELENLAQKTLRQLGEVSQSYQKLISNFVTPDAQLMRKDRAEIILYVSGLKDVAYQANMWIPVLERLDRKSAIVIREKEVAEGLLETNLPVYYMKTMRDLELLNNGVVKKILYPANTQKNVHALRFYKLQHYFINHGESDKVVNQSKFLMAYDKLLVAGPLAEFRLRNGDLPIRDNQIVHVGRPQVELNLRQTTAPTTKIKTILYAPTWEGFVEEANYSSVNEFGLSVLQELSKKDDIKVLFKPHPYTGYNKNGRCGFYLEKMKGLCESQSNITLFDSGADINGLMNDADLLITDVSSVLNDFLYTLKPMVLTNPREQDEEVLISLFPSSKATYVLHDPIKINSVLSSVKLNDLRKFPQRVEVCHYSLGDPAESYIKKFNHVVCGDEA